MADITTSPEYLEIQAQVSGEMTERYKEFATLPPEKMAEAHVKLMADINNETVKRLEKIREDREAIEAKAKAVQENFEKDIDEKFEALWSQPLQTRMRKIAEGNDNIKKLTITVGVTRQTRDDGEVVLSLDKPHVTLNTSLGKTRTGGGGGRVALKVTGNGVDKVFESGSSAKEELLGIETAMNVPSIITALEKKGYTVERVTS